MTGTSNSEPSSGKTPDRDVGPAGAQAEGARMRVADLRERIRRELDLRGVRLRAKELRRVIHCGCGYEGFALRVVLFWRCPKCARRARYQVACYDLPVEGAAAYIPERERLAHTRRWVRIATRLVGEASSDRRRMAEGGTGFRCVADLSGK